jgi:hypothetical protein
LKKTICYILLFGLAFKNYAQEQKKNDYFSFEGDVNYYNYPALKSFSSNAYNVFSYGFSLHAAKYIHKIKLSIGLNFSSMSLTTNETNLKPYDVKRRDYKLEYRNIPILFNTRIAASPTFTSGLLFGFVISHTNKYDITSYYINGVKKTENAKALGFNDSNLLFMFGSSFSILLGHPKPLEDRIALNFQPSLSFKLTSPSRSYNPLNDYHSFRNGTGIMFGFKIGIEYFFRMAYFTRMTGF